MIPSINPWKGLQPYIDSEDDLRLHPFCGRENVIREVFELIDNNIVTTLYGKSGIGKTSLFNAGLFPVLRKEDYIPIYVRLGTDCMANESFAECIVREINAHTQNLDNRISNGIEIPGSHQNDYLWAFFASHSFYTRDGNVKYPVIVLDQFEEIFNENAESVKQLLLQLQELTSDKLLPDGNTFVVNFRIAISIREDDLYLLEDSIDSYYIPELKANRYRLKSLSKKEATRVVEVRYSTNEAIGRCIFEEEYFSDIVDGIINLSIGNDVSAGINTQVLSLCCFLLYNYSSTNHKLIEIGDVHNLKGNLIGTFYDEATKNLTESQHKIFEEKLITDNNRRSAWSKKNFRETICNCIDNPQIESNFLIGEFAILRNVTTHGEECVELIHDLLCPIIIERKNERERTNKIRRENQQRVQEDLNVLTVRGRRLLNNTVDFGGFSNAKVDSPIEENMFLRDNLLDFNLKYHFHSKTKIEDFIKNRDDHGHSILLEYRNDNNEQVRSIDGISKYELYYDKETLRVRFVESVYTISGYIDRPFYIQGYCGILVKFETYTIPTNPDVIKEREIERAYLDENNSPILTIDGYAVVRRHYDNNGNIDSVLFYDDKDNPQPCPHRNGNYGYKSKYDFLGREIERIFIDKEGNPTNVTSGIAGRQFDYDSENRIISVINIGKACERIRDKDGYCAVKFEYDEESRISIETYLDENLRKLKGNDGYCITCTSYRSECNGIFVMEERYRDENENDVADSTTKSYINRYSYDKWLRPIKYEYLNNKKTPTYPCIILSYENFRLSKMTVRLGSIISNQWIQLDRRNQFIEKIGYLDIWGRKAKDEGAYGKQFIRDERDLTLKGFLYLNAYGKPSSNDLGIFEQKWICEKGKKISELYYDSHGKIIADELGVFGRLYEYNQNGNCVTESFVGENGKSLINNIYGYASILSIYDENGKISKRKFLNNSNVSVANEDGDYCLKYNYSEFDNIAEERCISCGQDDNKHNNIKGYCVIVEQKDSLGRIVLVQKQDLDNHIVGIIEKRKYFDDEFKIESSYYDSDFRLTKGQEGWARRLVQFDEKGRYVYSSSYDETGNMRADSIGDYGTKYEYPDDRVVRVCSLNSNNELCINQNGYAIREITYDELGREIKNRYLGINEESVFAKDDREGYIVKYLSEGNSVEICIDEYEEVCKDKHGISRKLIERDKYGRITLEYYFDIKGNPKRDWLHDYGTLYQYKDNKVFQIGLAQNGSPHKNKLGWVTRLTTDGESVYLDENNHKVGYFRQLFYLLINCFKIEKVKPINHLMIRMSVEQDGHFRKSGLEGYYLLLNYNRWSEGMPIEKLLDEFSEQNAESVNLEYVRLNLAFEGMTLGEIYKRKFPTGKLGVRIKPLNISEGLYRELMLMWKGRDVKETSIS